MIEWNKNFGFRISMTLTQQESWFHPFSVILWHLRFLRLRSDILRLSQFLAIGFSPSELHVYNSAICKKGDRLFRCHFWSIFIVAAFPAYADSCIELVPHRNQLPMPGIFLELELESACILESGVYGFSTNLTRSNTTTISPDNNLIYPRLILDHEREEVS